MTLSIFPPVQRLRVAEIPLAHIGPLFERNPVFPARINTEFVEVVSRTRLKMRVWERGAGMSPFGQFGGSSSKAGIYKRLSRIGLFVKPLSFFFSLFSLYIVLGLSTASDSLSDTC
jgi:hypothetical protein